MWVLRVTAVRCIQLNATAVLVSVQERHVTIVRLWFSVFIRTRLPERQRDGAWSL